MHHIFPAFAVLIHLAFSALTLYLLYSNRTGEQIKALMRVTIPINAFASILFGFMDVCIWLTGFGVYVLAGIFMMANEVRKEGADWFLKES